MRDLKAILLRSNQPTWSKKMLNHKCFIHDINWRKGWLATYCKRLFLFHWKWELHQSSHLKHHMHAEKNSWYSKLPNIFLSMWMYWRTKVIIRGQKFALKDLSKIFVLALSSPALFFSGWNKKGSGKSIVWPSLYSLYYSGHFYVGYFPPPGHKVAIKKIFHFLLNQHTFYLLKRQCVIFVQTTTFYPLQPPYFQKQKQNI